MYLSTIISSLSPSLSLAYTHKQSITPSMKSSWLQSLKPTTTTTKSISSPHNYFNTNTSTSNNTNSSSSVIHRDHSQLFHKVIIIKIFVIFYYLHIFNYSLIYIYIYIIFLYSYLKRLWNSFVWMNLCNVIISVNMLSKYLTLSQTSNLIYLYIHIRIIA